MTLRDNVPTAQGEIIIITKTRHLFFFTKPRTSVMPMGLSEFGRRPGFQAVYRTTDSSVLQQFHEFWVTMVAAGGFEAYLMGARMGLVDFPPDAQHLRGHIFGFHA
jgi:hypothetical protein